MSERTLQDAVRMHGKLADANRAVQETALAPTLTKELKIRFGMKEAAVLVGRSDESIRTAEKDGRLPAPEIGANGRRLGYTVADLQRMRQHFGTLPWRTETDEPVIMAVYNFKGGVGKSTLTLHLAHYLALKGYRVLIMDADAQGSQSALNGLKYGIDFESDRTLSPFLDRENPEPSLHYAICNTAWPNVDIIPACVELFNTEYDLIMSGLTGVADSIRRLRHAVNEVAQAYDVVLIDSPPALNQVGLAVLQTANALLVPMPPNWVDAKSSEDYMGMIAGIVTQLENSRRDAGADFDIDYKFIKYITTRYNNRDTLQSGFREFYYKQMPLDFIEEPFLESAAISGALQIGHSIYELAEAVVHRDTLKRCRANLESLFGEIETLIRRSWPSTAEALGEVA
ncbi:MAG TPA: AAA family ATPase [Pedomonas sp.]|uniref:AAA family ATPase n=1 Tax=Pedomonas sp. TaxID=2976421 RepID=UPI002F416198